MDHSDLEEGELTDSGDEAPVVQPSCNTKDSASSEYTLLPRPTNPAMSYRAPQESIPPAHTFRESPKYPGDDSDCDSDDSEDGVISKKKARLHPIQQHVPPQASAARKNTKKFNIWADVLLEDSLSSKIKSSGTILRHDVDTVERGVESYRPSGESRTVDFDTIEQDQEVDQGDLWDVNEDGESANSIHKRVGKRNRARDRLEFEFADDGFENEDLLNDVPNEVSVADDDRVIARYIARNLNEPKIVLIERVTRFAGKQLALDLFNATMDVEQAGGMMTNRGDVRRTPGGVFLQLLKKHKNISKDTIKDIFAIERENQKFTKKVLIRDRQIRKRKYTNHNKKGSDRTGPRAPPVSDDREETEAALEEFELMEEPDIEIGVSSTS